MQCHDDMHLLEQGSDRIDKRPQAAPPKGQRLIILAKQSIIGIRLAHDTPATLCMKRQTYYIIVIDIYNLRSSAELWRKLLLLGKA